MNLWNYDSNWNTWNLQNEKSVKWESVKGPFKKGHNYCTNLWDETAISENGDILTTPAYAVKQKWRFWIAKTPIGYNIGRPRK